MLSLPVFSHKVGLVVDSAHVFDLLADLALLFLLCRVFGELALLVERVQSSLALLGLVLAPEEVGEANDKCGKEVDDEFGRAVLVERNVILVASLVREVVVGLHVVSVNSIL